MGQLFDREFRDHAVKMALAKKVTQKQLAEDLGIGKSTLTSWIRAYKRGIKGYQEKVPNKKRSED